MSARAELSELARAFAHAPIVSLDVESDGMFAYRAQVCTVQLAAAGEVAIVDGLATTLEPLAALLGETGPPKVVHDVAFDARMLAELGLPLGNVRDTAIAARLLGRPATGLAALARTELGVTIDKGLQHHDWRRRPLLPEHLDYLARDVAHLEALAAVLWRELAEREIEEEVLEETRHRIANAVASVARAASDPDPAYAFAKGFDRLGRDEQAVFRRIWAVREAEAQRIDAPAGRMLATDALLALARSRPRTAADLAKTRLPRELAQTLAPSLLEAVARGIEDGDVPEADRARFEQPRPSREASARRRAREVALTTWRRQEAKRRGVDEQVVLPGHCLKDLAEADGMEVGTIQAVPGFGACRTRYVEAIALALQGAEKADESG